MVNATAMRWPDFRDRTTTSEAAGGAKALHSPPPAIQPGRPASNRLVHQEALMRVLAATFIGAFCAFGSSLALRAATEPPAWAYAAVNTPAPAAAGAPAGAPPAANTTPRSLPGSTLTFPPAQIRDAFGPADWFPGDHPVMPEIVAKGKRPDVRACALCHMPNGKGRPENAGVSGLPVAYFIQQMHDFRNGVRKSAEPRKANTNLMITIAKGMTEEEIKASAEYFGSMKWTPWIRVVETKTVAKTRIQGGMYLRLEGGEMEPLGMRIIETPENVEHTEELRDPRSGFIAFVPVGSVKKGEALVTTGGKGKTVACGVCHGADLNGLGPVPGIAGRSPSYLVRQMYDMQAGARHGVWTDLMKPVVAKLADEDFVNIAAYLSSRTP
jgi:cytochrome c553